MPAYTTFKYSLQVNMKTFGENIPHSSSQVHETSHTLTESTCIEKTLHHQHHAGKTKITLGKRSFCGQVMRVGVFDITVHIG